MSTNTYIVIIVIGIIVLGGFLFFYSRNAPEQTALTTSTSSPSENGEGQSLSTVTYTNSGYLPREVTILAGGTVTFKNESSRKMWTATTIHPTHTIYPGSGIQKCGTPERSGIFDACKDIAQGESWSFTFKEQGSWRYHDHRNPSSTGKIIVE